jgi:hypothetical protein
MALLPFHMYFSGFIYYIPPNLMSALNKTFPHVYPGTSQDGYGYALDMLRYLLASEQTLPTDNDDLLKIYDTASPVGQSSGSTVSYIWAFQKFSI